MLSEQIDPDSVASEAAGQPPHAWFTKLRDSGKLFDATRFVTHALPRYECVVWGAQALLSMGAVERLDPNMVAVLRWIDQPSDALRREAGELAEATRRDGPAKMLGLAVMMSGGSLSAPEYPPVLPPTSVCAHLVAAAVLTGAHLLPDPSQALQQALAAGEAMAQGE